MSSPGYLYEQGPEKKGLYAWAKAHRKLIAFVFVLAVVAVIVTVALVAPFEPLDNGGVSQQSLALGMGQGIGQGIGSGQSPSQYRVQPGMVQSDGTVTPTIMTYFSTKIKALRTPKSQKKPKDHIVAETPQPSASMIAWAEEQKQQMLLAQNGPPPVVYSQWV